MNCAQQRRYARPYRMHHDFQADKPVCPALRPEVVRTATNRHGVALLCQIAAAKNMRQSVFCLFTSPQGCSKHPPLI